MRLRLPDPPHNRPRWNPPLKTRYNIASFGLHYLSGSLRLSTATRYRLIVHLHDLRERPPASGCPGRASPAAGASFARRRAGPGGPAQAWRPAPPYLLQLSGGEEDGLLQRVQGAVEQGFALRQIGPLLSLRPEAEVVITTLVDVQPHGFAGCGEGIVQRDGDRHQAVCGAHQNQDRGADRLDVLAGDL